MFAGTKKNDPWVGCKAFFPILSGVTLGVFSTTDRHVHDCIKETKKTQFGAFCDIMFPTKDLIKMAQLSFFFALAHAG